MNGETHRLDAGKLCGEAIGGDRVAEIDAELVSFMPVEILAWV